MKKFTSLMMVLLCAITTSWAAATDLPTLTTDAENPVWYLIKNVRRSKYATYAGDNATMTQQEIATAAAFFYFTGSITDGVATVKIHNYVAGDKLCAAYNSWTTEGIDWYIKAQSTGISICTSTGEWNAWNDAGGNGQKVEYWSASDPGSAWIVELVTDFSSVIDAAKEAAVTELQNLASVSVIYPDATEAITNVNAVAATGTSFAELNAAIVAVNAIVAEYKTNAYIALNGKYFSINTPGRADGGYLTMSDAKVIGTASLTTINSIWQFIENNGKVYIYNPYTGKYLGEPGENSSVVPVTKNQADAALYDLVVYASASNADAKIKLTSNEKSVHVDGSFNLVRWNNGAASEYTVSEITDFTSLISTHKTNTIATLDEWATLSVVFDAELIATAKAAVEAVETTGYDAFAEIDSKLTYVTDAVAAKKFTFRNTDTNSQSRVDAYLAANMNDNEGHGTQTFGYNAIWSLRPAGGTSFYLYNELNNVYLGSPSSNGDLTAEPTAAYSFEIIDADTNKAELKHGSETLHLNNHTDGLLSNYDNDDAASRWYISDIDLTNEQIVALDGLQTAYDAKVIYKNATIGNGLGEYTGDNTALAAALANAEVILSKTLAEQAGLSTDDITSAATAINNAAVPTLNMPVAGTYIRIKGACEAELKGYYITGNTNADGGRIACAENGDDASTIYYYADGKLLSYSKGHYIALSGSVWTFGDANAASAIEFAESSNVAGAYSIKSADRYLHYTVYNGTVQVNRCSTYDADKNHDWYLEEVTELPVTITAAGYATFYAPVDVTYNDIEDIEAFYTTGEVKDEKYLQLVDFEGTIPATDGAILKGNEGTYNLTISSGAEKKAENKLTGTAATTVISKEAANSYYVLGRDTNDNVGLYNPINGENTNVFTNTGHKAYMLMEGAAQTIGYSLGFDWGGTTGIENIEDAVEENATKAIYDITGRQIKAITVPGIYIINGKKTFVK